MTDAFFSDGFDPGNTAALPFCRVPGLQLIKGNEVEGEEPSYFLKAPNGHLLVLREQERLLWDLLDGRHDFPDIAERFHEAFGSALAPAHFARFIDDLGEARALEQLPSDVASVAANEVARARRVTFGLGEPVLGPNDIPHAPSRSNARRGGRGAARGGRNRGTRAKARKFMSWRIGNPEPLLKLMARIYWPIRYAGWLIVPLVFTAFMVTVKHGDQYYNQWIHLVGNIPEWPYFIVVEHLITWSARVVEGMVVYGFGGRIVEARAKLFLGMFIRLQLDEDESHVMTRRQKLWIAATPLIWRLVIFAYCMVLWALTMTTHVLTSQIAMFIAWVALLTFITCSCPLIPLYGYKFLAILLNQENLRGRAFKYLSLRMSGRPAPNALSVAERWGLGFMAIGTALLTTGYFGHILWHQSDKAITYMGGLGVWFGIGIITSFVAYIIALMRFSAKLRAMQRANRVAEVPLDASGAVL